MRSLECLDGTRVERLVPAANGSRHHVFFGVEAGTGIEVVAKVELMDGALETERRALAWGAAHGAGMPALRAFTRCALPGDDGEPARCLISERVPGSAPDTPDAWARMGRALARLAAIPWEGCGLATLTAETFAAGHHRRATELGERLAPALDQGTDFQKSLVYPLVLTHGDPGGGNYLDDGATVGTLLDWETAHVAPRGLDLARAVFIALIDGRPERAAAVREGYLAEADWRPTPDELRAWLVVAGVQFAHWRWEHRDKPRVRPWQDAVDVLARALNDPERDRAYA